MVDRSENLRALVVGFGSIGRRHTRVIRELGLTDIVVCEPSPDLRTLARDEYGITRTFESYDEALAHQPDAVFICTPTAMHIPQAIQAVQSGSDVFIEKPLSVSLDGIDELEALARERRRVVMVGHCFRFHEGLLEALCIVESGSIGRVVSIRAVMGEYISDVMPSYRNMYISQYSGVYELMHDVDLALWFADQPPVRVMARDGNVSDVGMKSPDLAEMLIEFRDRCMASVHLDFFERARHRQIEIMGVEGTVIVEFASWDRCTISHYDAESREWNVREMRTERDDMFRAEDGAFLASVLNRGEVPVDIRDGRAVVEVILAAQESSRTGRSVEI